MATRSDSGNTWQRAQADALQQAAFALQSGRPPDAERIARDILKTNAAQPDAAMFLGYALLMQERTAEAVAPLETAARASHNPEIETQLAIALRRTGKDDQALTWLQRAVKRTPPFPPAYYELAQLLHVLKRSDEAIAVLKQGTAAAPMIPELWSQLGFICNAVGDRAGAADAFSRALEINPVHPAGLKGLTSVLMRNGDFAQAAELFKRAIAAHPEEGSARIGLGKCLLELGEMDAAYASLRAGVGKGVKVPAALNAIVSSSRGRFWLRPSRAAEMLKSKDA